MRSSRLGDRPHREIGMYGVRLQAADESMILSGYIPIYKWGINPSTVHGVTTGTHFYRDLNELYAFENEAVGHIEIEYEVPTENQFKILMNPPVIKRGDIVTNDLDGKTYKVFDIDSRDILDPLPGVKRLGDAVILEDELENKLMVYSWEITKNEI
jgi:hypothetical protein